MITVVGMYWSGLSPILYFEIVGTYIKSKFANVAGARNYFKGMFSEIGAVNYFYRTVAKVTLRPGWGIILKGRFLRSGWGIILKGPS